MYGLPCHFLRPDSCISLTFTAVARIGGRARMLHYRDSRAVLSVITSPARGVTALKIRRGRVIGRKRFQPRRQLLGTATRRNVGAVQSVQRLAHPAMMFALL